jgi:hypothetical protein
MHDRRGRDHMSTHVMINDSDLALLSTECRSRDVDRVGDRDVLRVDRCVDEANEEGHVFYLAVSKSQALLQTSRTRQSDEGFLVHCVVFAVLAPLAVIGKKIVEAGLESRRLFGGHVCGLEACG